MNKLLFFALWFYFSVLTTWIDGANKIIGIVIQHAGCVSDRMDVLCDEEFPDA